MGFSFNQMGFANLFENGHNFILFSLMGMMIVFAGLSFISIYITLLPKILSLPQKFKTEKHTRNEGDSQPETVAEDMKDSELLLAIAVALHLDQTSGSSYEKITWKRYEAGESAWLTAGRLRGLAVRSHLPDRRG